MWYTYIIIAAVLLATELLYFKIADKCNIIDKPNERSSHSTIVLRGGGIIFLIGAWIWGAFFGLQYPWFLIALTMVAGISFIDDIHSLPDSARLVCQFAAMILMFYQIVDSGEMIAGSQWWVLIVYGVISLIVCVGASNIINFMDGINGITGAYAFAVMIPILVENIALKDENGVGFVNNSFIITMMLADLVFCFFNFRPRGKAKCFAGDVGSLGVAFILLFMIGSRVMATGDVTYLVFLAVYGVDGVLTICHRIMLHENLGQAHRKHAFQLMANELKMSHITVSLLYASLQLAISLVFIYLVPNTILAHWVFMIGVLLVLSALYVLFMKKYYHLHEEYLASLNS